MTLKELRQTLAKKLLLVDEADDSLLDALNFVHTQIQMDFDWRCMDAELNAVNFTANTPGGIVVDATYKTFRHVYLEHSSTSGTQYEPVTPSTEEECNKIKRLAWMGSKNLPANLQGTSAPLQASNTLQRWYDYGRKLHLLLVPTVATPITVVYTKILPAYSAEADTDWFSENYPQILIFGAAAYYATYQLEDDRSAKFAAVHQQMIAAAQLSDKKSRQGGLGNTHRPPLPQNYYAKVY